MSSAIIDEKASSEHVEADVGFNWERYGSEPELVEAYKTIMSWTPEERSKRERTLVRKLDLMIMLPVVIMYVTNYLDRNSIAQARVSGLATATHITNEQYSLVNGIFCGTVKLLTSPDISYIFAQPPANLILSKSRPSIFLPCAMALWAIVSTCTAATTSLGTLVAVRFILGICEGPFFPGAAFWLTCWYTRAEIGRRYALYVGGICLSSAFGGLISAGIISGLSGKHGIAGWQWIFIIEGALTFCVAIIVFFVIPDYPHTAKKLKPIDRVLAQLRLDEDAGTTPSTKEPPMREGFMMAVKDYRTWCIGTLQFCITNMIGFNFFYPTLIEGLGYTNNITILLLSAPPYIAALIFSFCMGLNADRTNKRILHWEASFAVTAVGLILLIGLANVNSPGGRYACTYILAAGSFAAYSVAYPWVASLVPRPLTKRAVVIAIANSLSNLGAFVSSYVFYSVFGPTYRTSWIMVLGMTLYSAIMVWWLKRMNDKRNVTLAEVEERYKNGEISDAELETMEPDAQMAARAGFRLGS
ncbi:hypothetical protein EHS25_008029 [Saitozyma podzolica]|uniref:Major facilitator superfamily (MFS) profile domain-containing protein n=1 Tax=Saitozyma podzolica TaxID=1890683 RepID=A0A427YNA1_9TREE|nr:hypothetical protein EHS25_008029 [Saitozyma podzolica]